MRVLPLLCALAVLIVVGCSNDKTEVVHRNTDMETAPTMMTRDVVTLISDSGITRYRITTDLWLVYDEATEPLWRFPEGLFMEKFDETFSTDATILCDSATYFKNKQLWRLDGNVNILNTLGEKFLTQQLYWDQRLNKVYSDSFIHIERADRTIEGVGFESNDRMTRYNIMNPTGIFPASQFQRRGDGEEASDSASVEKPEHDSLDIVIASPPVAPPAKWRQQAPKSKNKATK
ncbi:MAG: LPS export ABC transporter periplasmic protein LptC [Muribaculum sp.]|nr:LPS export ABC transporter periplasmic protein LptC [Muribaculum sp.]